MGFKQPDLDSAYRVIRKSIAEISSPYNDGFTAMACKHELYQLKCFIEEAYVKLPKFEEEKNWEQERIMKVLKK